LAELLLTGLVLGLSLGPFCALSCGPLLGVGVAGELGRGGRGWSAGLRFLAGRLIAYAAVGAATGGLLGGWLRRAASSPSLSVGFPALAAALGILLLVVGARAWRRGGSAGEKGGFFCVQGRFARLAGLPFAFGLFAGISPCPQFLLAALGAARAAGWLGGVIHFMGLYAGSSVFLAPALLVRARSEKSRRLAARVGTSAAILVGLFYALSGLRGLAEGLRGGKKAELTREQVLSVLPGAEYTDGPNAGYRRSALGGELVGVALRGEGNGYAGGLVCAVGVSPEGKILRVRILSHGETDSFMETFLEGKLLEGLAGRSAGDPLRIGKDLDAVSSATRTSEGVAAAVRNALSRADPRGAAGGGEPLLAVPDWKAWTAIAYLVLAACLLPRLRGKVRLAAMAASVAVMGALAGRFLSVTDATRAATGMLGSAEERTGLLLFIVALAAVTLWRGRMWCSHVCPFGCLTELGGRLTRARARLPGKLGAAARVLPWVTLGAVSAAIAWTGRTGAAGAEPFGVAGQLLRRPHLAASLWASSRASLVLFALLVVASLLSMRFYCRYLCGAGALLKVLARARARGAAPGEGEGDDG
jgi:uncharacterized protein with FMN-binding domain